MRTDFAEGILRRAERGVERERGFVASRGKVRRLEGSRGETYERVFNALSFDTLGTDANLDSIIDGALDGYEQLDPGWRSGAHGDGFDLSRWGGEGSRDECGESGRGARVL